MLISSNHNTHVLYDCILRFIAMGDCMLSGEEKRELMQALHRVGERSGPHERAFLTAAIAYLEAEQD